MHILACPPSISILTMKVIPMCLLLLSNRFVESFLAPACGGGRRLVFCQEILPRTKQLTTLFSSSPSVDASDPKKKNGHTTIPSIVGMEEEYEGYARCLSPREERREVEAEFIEGQSKRKALWTRSKSFFLGKLSRRRQQKPGTLILLRCGQSTLNQNATFTGWLDPPLTPLGVEQCRHAGALLRTEGLDPDVVYTSRLQRSIGSAWNLLETLEALYIPIQKTFRLNQRMYGSLQGLSKAQVADECGPQVVQAWRNGLKARPPALSRSDPSHPIWDPRYADLPPDAIPDTESLWDCQERARALWEHKISRDIQRGKTVLVIGHRDSLRGLSKVIDGIDEKHIESIAIPAGVPIVYKFEKGDAMTPMEPDDTSLTQVHTRGSFLEKPGSLQQALAQNQEYEQQAFSAVASKEGYNSTATSSSTRRTNTLETSLLKLRQVEDDLKEDIRLGASFGIGEDDDNVVQLTANATARPVQAERWDDDECEFEEYEYDEFADDAGRNKKDDFVLPVQPLAEDDQPLPNPLLKGPYVVLIRHGRTPHNNMQLFTGWEDPPLAEGGVEDAINAGKLLKRHGFEFDVLYTSWLTRAIQTGYYVLLELDATWLPIVKSWRLNERMYGALTGKSKKMIANEYGEEQLKKWRRGYTIRPPPTSSYSLSYPGNDERRAKHFKDLPINLRETINRSIEQRRLVVHRKFPKSESLKDCMDRSIPFYTQRIQKEAIDKGKRVLITSHENAIRGILMHLCDIPEDAMNQLHLPNGLPLVYSVRHKCISLLDDGSGRDPMEAHDFGPAAKYLFGECILDDDEEEP